MSVLKIRDINGNFISIRTIKGDKGETGADGTDGTDGREVELQKNDNYIQWRYVGDTDWNNLIPISDLKGDKGDQGEQGIQGIQGIAGENGKEIELQSTTTYIQWRYVGETTWNDLLPLSSIKGDKGDSALTFSVGTTTTGTEANVVNSGTDTDIVLDFILPKQESKSTVQGTSLSINNANGSYSAINFKVEGKSEQDGTPTPESPVEIKTVKGINHNLELKISNGEQEQSTLIDMNKPNLLDMPYTSGNPITDTSTKSDYYVRTEYYATLEAGKKYKFSCETDGTWGHSTSEDTVEAYLMLNNEFTTVIYMSTNPCVFTPTVSGNYYVRYDINMSGKTHSFWNFKITESQEYYELSSIGDTKDILTIQNGKAYINQKIGKIVLDGSESWEYSGALVNTGVKAYLLSGIGSQIKAKNETNGYSNRFIMISGSSEWVTTEHKNSGYCRFTSNNLYIRISETLAPDLATLKTWLSNNPVTVYYELVEPQTITLNGTYYIDLFEDINNITTNDELQPNMIMDYWTNIKGNQGESGTGLIELYSEDNSNPICLFDLEEGIYNLYGYIKYYPTYTGTAALTSPTLATVQKSSTTTYIQLLQPYGNKVIGYEITSENYISKEIEPIEDSGWIEATLTSDFKIYNDDSNNTPKYRKRSKTVEIIGVVAPTSELASGAIKTIFTLPVGYRPSKTIQRLQQGSGKNSWLSVANPTGTVQIHRYGSTSNAACPTTAWLPFQIEFMID